jgi:adenylate cyclase
MAFWNAPLDDAQHEVHACRAALEMLERVDSLNREREQEAAQAGIRYIPIKIGIGINTGRCVVGNMGSELRFQYTVMGDSVNLASRLEGQTALHGISLLIGSKTMQAVAEEFATLQVESILVKGKADPEVIYTVVGQRELSGTRDFELLSELWQRMLTCYRSRDWDGATEMLDRCRPLTRAFGLDELANVYGVRIREFRLNPPPGDWDGVFVAQTK